VLKVVALYLRHESLPPKGPTPIVQFEKLLRRR
jgi:hypothetical protein